MDMQSKLVENVADVFGNGLLYVSRSIGPLKAIIESFSYHEVNAAHIAVSLTYSSTRFDGISHLHYISSRTQKTIKWLLYVWA